MTKISLVIIQVLALTLTLCRASNVATTMVWGNRNLGVYKQQPLNILDEQFVNSMLRMRGGGEIELFDDDDDGIFIVKTRNIIRSILNMAEKKVPAVTKILKSFLSTLESMAGVKLLPAPEKTKKSKKESKKSSKSKPFEEEADDKQEVQEKKKESKASKKDGLKKPSPTTKKHLTSSIKSTNPNYRIQRELKEFIKSPPPNLSVQVGSNLRVWIVTMVGANNTIYEGDIFKLRVSFPAQYPTVPPSVYFLQGNMPTHEHVYTNGDICLSLLGKDWRPTMTAQSISMSILSILSSAQSKSLPMDNSKHAGNKPGQYQKDWVYHDDNC